MPTVTELLTTINLEYRNTYTDAQKVSWMNTVQDQIFQRVRHEAEPFTFTTISGESYYALPSDCDKKGIKQVAIETKASSGDYDTLRYVSVESDEYFSENDEFYSVEGTSNLFLNPVPTATDAGKKVYIYYNKRPAELSSASLSVTPDLEENFHELLILGVIERIARAQREHEDKQEYERDFNALLREYINQYKLQAPEYVKTKDVMPRRRGNISRRSRLSELIPD